MGRRVLWITGELIQEIATEGAEIHARCIKGLPEGARLHGLYYDASRLAFGFVYEHPDWEENRHPELDPINVTHEKIESGG